jgi:hypothetical protein
MNMIHLFFLVGVWHCFHMTVKNEYKGKTVENERKTNAHSNTRTVRIVDRRRHTEGDYRYWAYAVHPFLNYTKSSRYVLGVSKLTASLPDSCIVTKDLCDWFFYLSERNNHACSIACMWFWHVFLSFTCCHDLHTNVVNFYGRHSCHVSSTVCQRATDSSIAHRGQSTRSICVAAWVLFHFNQNSTSRK